MGPLGILGRLALTAGAVVWVAAVSVIAAVILAAFLVWSLAAGLVETLGHVWTCSVEALAGFVEAVGEQFAAIWEW